MVLSARLSRLVSFINRRFLAVVGVCLIVAAALKGHQVIYSGVPAASSVKSVPLHALWVTLELLLGVWLLHGLHQRISRIIVCGVFFIFWDFALWMAQTGRSSCGCLGALKVNPWWAVAFDSAVLLGLVLLRMDAPEKTIRSHSFQFLRFVVVALALASPGVITIAYFSRENLGRHELRHDTRLNDVKLALKERGLTAQDMMQRVAKETDIELSVDPDLTESFLASKPILGKQQAQPRRCSMILEVIASGMPARCRWLKTWNGYRLILDDPWYRSRSYWIGGLAFGIIGYALIFWASRFSGQMSGKIMEDTVGGNTTRVGELEVL